MAPSFLATPPPAQTQTTPCPSWTPMVTLVFEFQTTTSDPASLSTADLCSRLVRKLHRFMTPSQVLRQEQDALRSSHLPPTTTSSPPSGSEPALVPLLEVDSCRGTRCIRIGVSLRIKSRQARLLLQRTARTLREQQRNRVQLLRGWTLRSFQVLKESRTPCELCRHN
jgi:hypothetical protein